MKITELPSRARLWLARRRRAGRFGIPFWRSRDMRMPEAFTLRGRRIELNLLDEIELNGEAIEILLDDVYGLERLRNLRRVLDVGANHGLFALAVRGWFPEAVIHGYEPNPVLRSVFEHNYRLLDGVPFAEAVGAEDGWCAVDQPGGTISARVRSDRGPIRQVSLATAVERLGGRVDLLKLDCEGSEWSILRCREALAKIGGVTLEYHDFGLPDAVLDYRRHAEELIAAAGLQVIRHVPRGRFGFILAARPGSGLA